MSRGYATHRTRISCVPQTGHGVRILHTGTMYAVLRFMEFGKYFAFNGRVSKQGQEH
jgi:hypothetical protein